MVALGAMAVVAAALAAAAAITMMSLCKAPWGLRLGCEFVHLTDCETTWITTSFTICQEVLTEQRRGAPDQAL